MAVIYKNCCICIDLKTGSLIIGYLNLIVLICSMIISISNITVEHGGIDKTPRKTWTSVLSIYILIAVFIIAMIFSILLVIGVHGKKRSLVKVYLIFHSVFIIFYLIGLLTQLGRGGLNMLVNDLGVICVTLYYLMVIRSYYIVTWKEIKPNIENELPRSVNDI